MNFEELEKIYEKGEYELFVKYFLEHFKDEEDIHRLRLFFRAANRKSLKVFDIISLKNNEIKNDLDFLFNRFLFDGNFDHEECKKMFKMIITKERKDLYDDFMIIFLEREGSIFSDEGLLEFLLKNRNKSIVLDYVKNLTDDNNLLISFVSRLILRKDFDSKLKELNEVYPTAEISYEIFLKDKDDEESFSNFLKGLNFKKNTFVIYNNDINRIENYDPSLKIFTLKDKLGRVKRIEAKELMLKTSPIEENDFRVLKFFDPEKGKNLDICELIVSILKYKNSGLTKEQLKTELSFIYGKDAGSILNKKKKDIERCELIEIIYEEPTRYVLKSMQDNDLLKVIKNLKDEQSIRQYIFNILKTRKIEEEKLIEILNLVNKKCDIFKNEINFVITGDKKYLSVNDFDNYDRFENLSFKESLLIKAVKDGIDFDPESFMKDFEKDRIENVFRNLSDGFKRKMLEITEKSIRLGRPLNFFDWYLNFHLDEKLLTFDLDYIIFRSLNIANENHSKKDNEWFVNSVKKLFFQSKNKGIIYYLKKFKEESAKIIFDEIEKISYLTDHQKDLLKRDIYELYPTFLKLEKSDVVYSTREGIEKKRKEFEEIVNVKLPQLSKMIGEAAALGDLSENSEYKFAREQYSFFSTKAEELRRELEKTFPINFKNVSGEKVEIGVVVEFEDTVENKIRKYAILGPFDADPDCGIISYLSPLAQKLFGKRVGEEIEGKKILKISKWSEK
ncbi:MAG: GreA/GreB family elongation factor [candidate division WOR-3 bacterium]